MSALLGVGATFCASHHDNIRQELHGHSYEVVAWFPADGRDAVVMQVKLREIVKTMLDHKTLPPELGRMEDMRAALMAILGDAVDVEISRPLERIYCRGAE